jgi:oligosaccharide repeat unit polymerase
MKFEALMMETWLIITFAFVAMWIGTISVISSGYLFTAKGQVSYGPNNSIRNLFSDDGKTIKYLIFGFTLLGFLSTAHHWFILISKFGSVLGVVLNAALIYQMRIEGEVSTGIPYIFAGTHIALVLGGIYLAYKGKFSLILIFPFIVLILKSIAEVSRAGLLLGLFEFFITVIICKQALARKENKIPFRNRRLIFGLVVVLILLVSAATLVKTVRAPFETYKASTRTLDKLEKNVLISPTIYLYASSHLGVLNNYLFLQKENNYFGEVTFFPFYRLISKFEVIEEPIYYQRGYFIPMWSNTGTYLRDLHSDFGYAGVLLVPFLLGFITAFFWIKFYLQGNLRDLVVLIYTFTVIAFSFLLMATRFGNWLIGFVVLLVLLPQVENFIVRRSNKKAA